MNVGIYFDLRNPPGWRVGWSRTYGFALEMCEEADRLGAHSVWMSEHHLFDDGYLPQPLTFAAAVAARTKRVRIGTAVLIAPFRSSVEIAESVAIIDLISDGRVDLGLGAGYRVPEFELFGVDPSDRYRTTDQRAREVRSLWADGPVTPRPCQERVPIWMGYQGPKGAYRAGVLGEGLLSTDPALMEPYRRGLRDGGHPVDRGRMAGAVQAWVTNDPEADWPTVSEHLAYQVDSYRRHMVDGTGRPAPRPVDPDRMRATSEWGMLDYVVHDTPQRVADRIRANVAPTVETVILWSSLGGMPEDLVAAHVQTICTELGPLLAHPAADTSNGRGETDPPRGTG